MQIHIISVGKLSDEFKHISAKYLKMTRFKIKQTEITYAKKLPESQIKKFEADLIEGYLGKNSYKIILDVLGKQLSSEEFSKIFANMMIESKDIDFIIGGAFGLDDNILKKADIGLSLSKMTLPHQMAKTMLCEQIYRAQTILDKHPYHK